MKNTLPAKKTFAVFTSICTLFIVVACSSADISNSILAEDAKLADNTKTGSLLKMLPPPDEPVVLAVYNFEDKTGQQKPSESFPEYSRAVTQGGAAILSKALYDAGNGSWFTVLEREGLNNLIQERKIIRATRAEYATPDGRQLGDIGPMLYAGLLLEGGIISYETNTITGGAGASYLGVGGDVKYRRDIVTVALRAISVQSGQVVLSVNTSKTIFSTLVNGGINKFVAIDELLEIESGFSVNEPPQFAVRQAVELAVYSLVVEGAERGLWSFADAAAGRRVIANYNRLRDKATPVADLTEAPAALPYSQAPAAPVTPPPAPAPKVDTHPLPSLIQPPAAEGKALQQLPKDAKPNPDATPVAPPLESTQSETLQPYRQRGVVYCGPSGCVPAYEPPVAQ